MFRFSTTVPFTSGTPVGILGSNCPYTTDANANVATRTRSTRNSMPSKVAHKLVAVRSLGVGAAVQKYLNYTLANLIFLMYNLTILIEQNDPSRKQTTDWQELTRLTQGQPIVVERVRIPDKDLAIEGRFELPQLARLNMEDQVFVTASVRCHGSIKEMEQIFGVSYPTIKSRLNRISASLEFVETNPAPSRAEILDRLKRGEISAQEAIQELEALK